MERRTPLTTAEALAAAALTGSALTVLAAYLIDWAGFRFLPGIMLPFAVLSAMAAFAWLTPRPRSSGRESLVFVGVVSSVFAGAMWIARPAFLPLGRGPDLVHHLLLIHYIEGHWRLVHDPAVGSFLGEMAQYTPGSHILAALAGRWSGTNGLHALHAVVSASLALKIGFVFLIVLRLLPAASIPRLPFAVLGAILLFVPRTFLLASFTERGFVAQIVAELFAVAAWWALVVWNDAPNRHAASLGGLALAATFLTWPVWIGPVLLLAAVVIVTRHPFNIAQRVPCAALLFGPVAIVGGLYFIGRLNLVAMAGSGGDAPRPGAGVYGWWFLAASTAGLALAATRRRTRLAAVFAAAIVLQAVALALVARAQGTDNPYLALKMFYLLIYPQAVAGALVAAEAWRWIPMTPRLANRTAWILAVIVAAAVARPMAARVPRSRPSARGPAVSLPLERAGEWARAHVPPDCVEYLVDDDSTAYWLHLAMLGNPRSSSRTIDDGTYDLRQTLLRWVTPGGMSYAIADLDVIPKDIRNDFEVLAQFDHAAVVRRRDRSACP